MHKTHGYALLILVLLTSIAADGGIQWEKKSDSTPQAAKTVIEIFENRSGFPVVEYWGANSSPPLNSFYLTSICVLPNGDIVVTDSEHDRAFRLGNRGRIKTVFGRSVLAPEWDGGFFEVAQTPEGEIIFAGGGRDRTSLSDAIFVWNYSADGRLQQVIDPDLEYFLYKMNVAPDGTIYIFEFYPDDSSREPDVINQMLRINKQGEVLSTWGKTGSAPGEFRFINDIAVSTAGIVYLVDFHNQRIQEFSAQGEFLKEWKLKDPDQLTDELEPLRIEINQLGVISVLEKKTRSIIRYSADGTVLTKLELPQFFEQPDITPTDFTYDTSGNLYVCFARPNVILKISQNGELLRTYAFANLVNGRTTVSVHETKTVQSAAKPESKLTNPVDIAFARDGSLWVADATGKALHFSQHGKLLHSFATDYNPVGAYGLRTIRIGPKGRIYLSNYVNISVYSPQGVLIRKFENIGSRISGFDVGPDQSIYYVDIWRTPQIYRINKRGKLLNKWGTVDKKGVYKFSAEDVAVDSDGFVYVSAEPRHIQKFTSDGTYVDTFAFDKPYVLPGKISIASDGTILLAARKRTPKTIYYISTVIYRFSTDGQSRDLFEPVLGLLTSHILDDGNGRYLFCEYKKNRIQLLNTANRYANSGETQSVSGKVTGDLFGRFKYNYRLFLIGTDPNGKQFHSMALTRINGSFRFNAIPAGSTYEIWLSDYNNSIFRLSPSTVHSDPLGSNKRVQLNLSFYPPDHVLLWGQVKNSAGAGIAQARISDGTRTVLTDAYGYYALDVKQNMSIELKAEASGYNLLPKRRRVKVKDKDVGRLDFTASKQFAVRESK